MEKTGEYSIFALSEKREHVERKTTTPAFSVRERSEIYIGPAAGLLPGLLPEGKRVVALCDATIDRLYRPLVEPYERVLIGAGVSI